MANAIVKTERGDTLASIAARYYALHNSGGSGRASELGKVTQAIRRATPTRLAHVADRDPLPPDMTLFVPTLRDLHRAIVTDNVHLLGALRAHGLDHARKLFRYSVEQVVALLQPLPPEYDRDGIERAWMVTALANLDGVDHYTARHLYDEVGIHSLRDLARQSPATLDKVLRALVAPPHSRPPELAAQRHGERWIVSAKILVRRRLGELTRIKGRFFQVPFGAALAQRRAEHYEAVVGDESLTSEEAGLATRLGRLYRFQAALLRGNVGVRSGNWAEAIAGYQEARRHWHRLAEATGAASAVNDDDGLNLETCTEVARRLLLTLPGDDDAPLDAPPLPLRRGGTPGRYRLHGFSYEELAPNRQGEIRARLASVPVHQLPRRVRGPLQQAVLNKTWRELQGADPNLVKGLVPGAETILARDLGSQDRETLRRNLGGTKVGTLYGGASKLDLFDAAVSRVAVSELLPLVSGLWAAPPPGVKPQPGVIPAQTGGARDVLSDAAQAAYPPAFLDRPDVNPFTRFVVMPGEAGHGVDRFLPLTASFAADYEREILKPRLMSASSEDLLFEEDAWTSVSAFATMAPYAYASQIPLGLRQAYGKLHQPAMAARFGGARVNVYDAEGALVRDVAGSNPASLAFHTDVFLACSTSYTGLASAQFPFDLINYAETSIEVANHAYRHDDRATARSQYADVKCAIETVFPSFAEEASLAMTGVELAIDAINRGTLIGLPAERKLQHLTTLDVVVVQNGTSHRVMDGVFLSIRTLQPRDTTGPLLPRRPPTPYFEECVGWNPDTGEVTAPPPDVLDVDIDEEPSGSPSAEPGFTAVFVDNQADVGAFNEIATGRAEIYQWYLYCVAKIQAIDAGLNWYGYGDGFVPAWGFDHLYGAARDLCNRALEAEQRVFSLLQMYETAATDEFLASQAVELARTQQAVARAKVEQQVASNTLALAQSLYTVQQADAQAKKSGVLADVVLVTTAVVAAAAAVVGTVASGGAALPAAAAGVGAAAGPMAAFAGNVTGHDEDVDILNQALAVTNAVIAQNLTALAVAIAERDVAETQVAQAKEYVDFLLSKTLSSDAYYYLLGLAKEILEVYLHHANRMAWLAERALENETRQAYDLIAIDYTTQDELADLTRAQQITADLEALRSEYVAGQTARLQEVKWTIALSQLDPIAWRDLRDAGTATFVLRQRVIDRHFPGLHQHRLKDVHLTIVGLVPPEGARGVLVNPGVSWVRVPNEQAFMTDQVKTDWVTASLAGSQTFAPYDRYIMKQVLTQVVALTLSQFDARADRAVLSAPAGMLRPVEHLGLDSAWTLTLHRQSNNFDFRNIVDVELTFWFLAAYDGDLEQAQVNALTADGQKGLLTGLARTAFAVLQPQVWAPFVSEPADREALDLRYLTVDVANLPLWEAERKVTNILMGCARAAAAQSDEITLRLCCAHDPVGVRLKTKNGAVYSLIGVAAPAEVPPPAPDPVLTRWVKENLSASGVPDKDPQVRWVIKASPQQAGEAWLKRDVDGRTVSTASGPLEGWADGVIRYNDGGAWTDVTMQVKIAHRGGSVRLRLRDDGGNFYALQVTPSGVSLLKSTHGAETPLGTPLPLAYPADEYLLVDFSVVGDRLSAAVDGITLFAGVAGDSAPGELQKGTVALEVVATEGTKAVRIDDVKVWRLTGLGAAAEALLAEPFTTALPKDWTLVEGANPWAIAPQGHRVLDLTNLLNVVLSVDYRYQMSAS